MPRPPSQPAFVPQTYAELKRAVLAVVLTSRREIDRTWLMTYHETGRLIHVHLLLNKERADYGAKVFRRLAADTGTSSRSLHEFVQFYRHFPIVRTSAQLGWSHYALLCQVEDQAQRQELLTQAVEHGWSSPKLRERVRALNAGGAASSAADSAKDVTPPKPLLPKRGTVGVWRVVAGDAGPAVDLGFTACVDLPPATRLRESAFARLDAAGNFTAAAEATRADLYTYRAGVRRVVDGDTLWMRIHLRPGLWLQEKLRLRGLDCPEIATPEGRAARRFVEALVARAKSVTITTTKPDKWDRYLSDVFLETDDGEVFLNNHLLAHGHARRMDEYALTDWGE
jgi:endonuclease YncB( thermonuclease family)